ncbi:type VI secretion system tube protein Hcp [Klebsiella pneumoniae subsp. pneumoniae]|nr:type VI secretion system tube protein Hcp [Klebsiella pneumoniae subsp. pneumoniae]
MPLRLGSIELKSFSHGGNYSGRSKLGKTNRYADPSTCNDRKEFDQTTPLLYRAVCEGRTMKKATIKMYRILETGIEAEYFNIILENVKFTTVAPFLSPGGMSSTHLETLELRYEAITGSIPKGILSIVTHGMTAVAPELPANRLRGEIFAYGDTPEDFAMLTLATTKIYRWDEAPP